MSVTQAIEKYLKKTPHLTGFKMSKNQIKVKFSIYVISGARDFTKIKIQGRPRVEHPGDPVAEITDLRWVIIIPEKERNYSNVLLKRVAINTYEEL